MTYEKEISKLQEEAKRVFKKKLYYAEIGRRGPFGANGSLNAYLEFKKWRSKNKKISPMEFLKSKGMPYYPWNELDEKKIQKYFDNEAAKVNMLLTEELLTELFDSIKKHYKEVTTKELKLNDDYKNYKANPGFDTIVSQDTFVIATAFGQYMLEGEISTLLKKKAEIAIKRQSLSIFINRHRNKRSQLRMQKELAELLSDLSSFQ